MIKDVRSKMVVKYRKLKSIEIDRMQNDLASNEECKIQYKFKKKKKDNLQINWLSNIYVIIFIKIRNIF